MKDETFRITGGENHSMSESEMLRSNFYTPILCGVYWSTEMFKVNIIQSDDYSVNVIQVTHDDKVTLKEIDDIDDHWIKSALEQAYKAGLNDGKKKAK